MWVLEMLVEEGRRFCLSSMHTKSYDLLELFLFDGDDDECTCVVCGVVHPCTRVENWMTDQHNLNI
jgi:hypothetical protein